MLSKNINISIDETKQLFDEYGSKIFSIVVKHLLKMKKLSKDEKSFLIMLIKKVKNKSFFNKSYLIYISNGIISNNGNVDDLKKQLLFDLSVLSLQKDIIKRLPYSNDCANLYSLALNMSISCPFDSIEKEDDDYLFLKENKVVLKVKENKELEVIDGVNFLMQNKNPYHFKSYHPEVGFVEYDLGGKSLKEWIRQFRTAYSLIKKYSFDVYGEIIHFLDSIVPIGYESGRQISSSYSRSHGILYFSYTDEDIKQAEAIVHEVHHTIFYVTDNFYPFLKNSSKPKYYSSYRPDARPLRGCFLGLHAFVAVQNFYSGVGVKTQDEYSIERFIDAYVQNKKMIGIIEKYAQFNDKGMLFFEDIKTKFDYDADYFKTVSERYPTFLNKTIKETDTHFATAKNENNILLF
jgi:hypothetical protein